PPQSTLGGDDCLLSAAADRAGDQPLALAVAAVVEGGVKMVDAQLEAGVERGQTVRFGHAPAGHAGNRPTAQGDWRDANLSFSERAKVHTGNLLDRTFIVTGMKPYNSPQRTRRTQRKTIK